MVAAHGGIVHALRHQQVSRGQRRSFEIDRQNADDARRLAIQHDGAADHIGPAAEVRLPEAIRKERDLGPVGAIVVGREVPPQNRLDPQGGQEESVGRRATQADRRARGDIAIAHAAPGSDGFELLLGLPEIQLGAAEEEFIVQHGRADAQRNQPVAIGIRKAAKQNAIHYAEDGGGGPDTDGQRQDGEGAERAMAAEHPEG